jgi:hypothetical protein
MSIMLKPGTRLFNAVCTIEKIAVKAPAGAGDSSTTTANVARVARRPRREVAAAA